jgi:hypothetical protein
MIFAEYIEHDPAMPFQIFRKLGHQDWTGEGDRMIANVGRTQRLSGEPFYMCWWDIAGFARLDEWEAHFRTSEGRLYTAETPVSRAMRFTRNGLYDAIIGEGPIPGGLHLIEFFDPQGAPHSELRDYFLSRTGKAAPGRLVYLITRIGLLAPDPGGMALWNFRDYAAAENFIRATPPAGPARLVQAGLYRNFGEEIV